MAHVVARTASSLLALTLLVSCGSTSEVDESTASTAGTPTTGGAQPVAERLDRTATDSDSSGSTLDETTDAVHPAIAALSFTERVEEVARVDVAGDVWVLSKLPPATAQRFREDGLAGPDLDPSGGEVLLLDGERIVHSVSMNAFPPSFIEATDSMIYAGRYGDGGYPDSALVAIDLSSGRVNRLVFPFGDAPDPEPGPQWQVGTDDQRERFVSRQFGGIFP